MAPVAAQQNVATKPKRPIPPGIQTNGISSSASSPSPLMSAKKPPQSAKHPPNSASERSITASTVRPVNRARRETSSQILGRTRNSAGLRSGSFSVDMAPHDNEPPPYVVTDSYVLKKHGGRPPSLVVHMHATHFRFDGQDGMFPYKSPMKLFLEHMKSRTIPHDMLQYLIQGNVPFYDGCLIIQVHDHKSAAQAKDIAKPSSTTNTVVPSSIHNYNQWLTPSPYVPFPKEELNSSDNVAKTDEDGKEKTTEEKDKENMPAPSLPLETQKGKAAIKPRVFTVVLHPTPESLQMDLALKAASPKGADGRGMDTPGLGPPSTPMSLVPSTPTASSMPPPAKRQKREKTELDGSNIYAAEGQILLATTAPLMLEPTKTKEETILLLEAMAHPSHSDPPPQPKTRKRTVAEMAADEAAAAEQERYMLFLDERLSNTSGTQGAGGGDGDGQTGTATFEPRFERFKVIADIRREHSEKKEQEKIKQQENDRKLQQQRLQQQQEQAQAAAQRQQAEAERIRRETAAVRENQIRQAEAQQRQAAMAARAVSTPTNQTNHAPNMGQSQHAHPAQNNVMPNGMANGMSNGMSNGMPNGMANGMTNGASGGPPNAMANGMSGQAQARFQAQIAQAQAQASSPVGRQGTPQNMSSPMVGSAPMQQTNSGMAASPPRPASVVQNPAMSVPMAANMSARGSQQSHPSGTPRMPHSTPNMPHGTPINRPAMAATPRMTQASPPPNMMAQNSQTGQAMMMNNPGMNQHNPHLIAQMAAQQRAIAQQQHIAAMQNGGMNANMNGQGMPTTPQQQQHMMQMMQRQIMMQQQQQQQHGGMMNQQQQQALAAQYAQLQSMQQQQPGQVRQMTPQMQASMQAQLQQMARMGQVGGQMGNQMGNQMQRQVSGQMMNGTNPNMQAMAAMQMQQQQQQAQQAQQAQHQQAQQAQQAQQQHQQQQPQPQTPQQQQQMGVGGNVQNQISMQARATYQKLMQGAAQKYGGPENIPADQQEKFKQASWTQAQQGVQQAMAQRRAQHQMMLQQQQQQQLQQQHNQQQQMQGMGGQGMGGMMGHQGM